ncbi:MAG: hypothetical protein ACPLRZ_02800 [Thermovenabulum sp.]|uniref:hypothetical protein n=1 Tax=Thermovenabulum sp. TaxID=3100335 RepID=UPI003C7D6EF8
MQNNENENYGINLANLVMEIIQGKRGYSLNEIISLIALTNLLGIISFMNNQDIRLEVKNTKGSFDIKDLAAVLLSNLPGSQDKKINPAVLLNLVKALSSDSPSENKSQKNENENKNN